MTLNGDVSFHIYGLGVLGIGFCCFWYFLFSFFLSLYIIMHSVSSLVDKKTLICGAGSVCLKPPTMMRFKSLRLLAGVMNMPLSLSCVFSSQPLKFHSIPTSEQHADIQSVQTQPQSTIRCTQDTLYTVQYCMKYPKRQKVDALACLHGVPIRLRCTTHTHTSSIEFD